LRLATFWAALRAALGLTLPFFADRLTVRRVRSDEFVLIAIGYSPANGRNAG